MAKREPHWVRVFIRGLARLGNVRLAAEGAGVDFSTAYQRRKRHGDFAEAWEGALGASRAAEAADAAALPAATPPSPGSPLASPSSPIKGEELAVRPDGKVVRAGAGRWSVARERRFLTELADSANVRRAAAAAGLSTTALYARRIRHAAFRAAWDLAIDAGKARLQAYLIEAADRTFDPESLPVREGTPKVSVSEAVSILRLKGGEPPAYPTEEPRVPDEELRQVREAILAKLDRMKERMDEEKRAAGWTEHEGEWVPPGWVRVEAAG